MMFVTSMFLFAVFCLAAGFAKSAISIDVLNGVLGLCAASAVPPALGLLGAIYRQPGPRKNAAFASFAAGNPVGYAFGTISGGVATSLLGWRASFWWTAILVLVFTIVAFFSVPRETGEKQPFTWATLKRFDVIGTILTVCGIGMFTAALSLGQTAPHGWATGYVLALLIVGLGMIVGFVPWEMRFESPLMPMHIWKDRNFSLVMAILMLGCMSFTPSSFFLALYFQSVWQRSAIMVAVYLLPMAINGLIVNIFAGFFLHRISNKILMFAGASAYAIANLLFALNTYDSSYWAFCFPGLVILVIGADLEFNVANMFVMSSMPASQQSLAGGIFQAVTKLCVAVGFGIATVVYDAAELHPYLSNYWDEPTRPFAAVFWTSFAFSALSIALVPFLTIGTQGGQAGKAENDGTDISMASETRISDDKAGLDAKPSRL
jgi:MFS family permease